MNHIQPRYPRPSSAYWRSALLLVACVLAHWWALHWLNETTSHPSIAGAFRRPPVEVTLLSPVLPPLPAAAPVAADPAPAIAKPKPIVRRPKPAPRPVPATPVPTSPTITAPSQAPEPDSSVTANAPANSADAVPAASPEPVINPDADRVPAKPTVAAPAAAAAPADPAANAAPSVPLPALPDPVTLRFQIYLGNYPTSASVAQLQYTLEHDGEHYTVRSQGEATGLTSLFYRGMLVNSSTGLVSRAGLLPQHYTEQRGKGEARWAKLDYGGKSVSFSSGDTSVLVVGAQDRLSALLQLGLVARASPERVAAGQVVELPEVNLRNIETTRYRSAGDEMLPTAQGALRTLKLVREPQGGDREASAEVWLGYDQAMLPVRIRLTDKGGRVIDQMLTRGAQ